MAKTLALISSTSCLLPSSSCLLIYNHFQSKADKLDEYDRLSIHLMATNNQKFPLRGVLIVPFVLQLFAAVGLTGWLSLRNGQKAVNDVATQLQTEISARVKQHLNTYLATPHLVNRISADDARLGKLDLKDFSAIEHHLYFQLLQFQSAGVNSIIFGNLQRIGTSVTIRNNEQSVRTVEDPSNPHKLLKYSIDKDGNRIKLLDTINGYDIRTKSWYQKGQKTTEPGWSEIFTTGASRDVSAALAISAYRPVFDKNNRQLGIFSITMALLNISKFLENIQVGKSGKIFIVERDGKLVASSQKNPLLYLSNNQPNGQKKFQRIKAQETNDALINQASYYLTEKIGDIGKLENNRKLEFIQDGQRNFLQVIPFKDNFGLDWLIVVVIPEADFMEQINANTRITILLCLLALIVAIIMGIFTSNWIATPIRRLSQASEKIAQGELNQKIAVKGVDEIETLAESFNLMTEKLQESFTVLETRVEERTAELKEAKEDAENSKVAAEIANQAKSEFLANMSHELRTPLNGILGYAQILMRSNKIQETEQKGLGIIHQCGSHLLTLINDILDLSKIEAQRMELYPNEFHFLAFLQAVGEICRIKAEQKGITFINQFDPMLPISVEADEKRLRQVLINLLGNAIKFTDKGSVTFKVGVIESSTIENTEANTLNALQKIRFKIIDTGVGMSEEQREKIFTPFEQVGETKRMAEGTGLGLAISAKIIEIMGSQIRVTSQLGAGSQFWFDLDLPCASEFTLKPSFELKGTIVNFTGNKRKILVVDDRWENRSVIVNLLTPVGFEVVEAENGAEGLEKVNEFKPDAIITDLVMPVMDGFELLRQLQMAEKLKEIIVIVSSASVFESDQYKSLDAGANAFLPKPVQVSELFELLAKQLGVSWIYAEPTMAESTKLNRTKSESKSLVIPPPEILANLQDLAKKGNLKAIIKQAEDLKKLDEKWIPFAESVCEMAKGFQEKQLRAFLNEHQVESTSL